MPTHADVIRTACSEVVSGLNAQLWDCLSPSLFEPLIASFERFLLLALRWNEKVNIVGTSNFEELVISHLADSFAAALILRKLIGGGDGLSVLDIGSGGGFPGVVLGLVLDRSNVVLCEPRLKRATFLREVRRELSLANVSVEEGRVEAIPAKGQFISTIARAVGRQDGLLLLVPPLLAKNGFAIQMVGPSFGDGKDVGLMKFRNSIKYFLPGGAGERALAVWQME